MQKLKNLMQILNSKHFYIDSIYVHMLLCCSLLILAVNKQLVISNESFVRLYGYIKIT